MVKPLDDFSRLKRSLDGYAYMCKVCDNERRAKVYSQHMVEKEHIRYMTEVFPDGTKRCCRCGEVKPIGQFYRHGKTRDGHALMCKSCDVRHLAIHSLKGTTDANGRYLYQAFPDGTKRCTTCGEVKPMTEFFANPKAPDGHTYDCKICVNARNSRNYYEHRDHYRKMGAAYYAAHKAECEERTRKNRELKPYRNWAMHTIRNHQSSGYTVNLTYDELEEIAKRTTQCPICECELDWRQGGTKCGVKRNSPTLDRKYNGDRLSTQTTWILCGRCNGIKSDMPMPEFVEFCRMVVEKFGKIAGPCGNDQTPHTTL